MKIIITGKEIAEKNEIFYFGITNLFPVVKVRIL
jgi:hypothetical protein